MSSDNQSDQSDRGHKGQFLEVDRYLSPSPINSHILFNSSTVLKKILLFAKTCFVIFHNTYTAFNY